METFNFLKLKIICFDLVKSTYVHLEIQVLVFSVVLYFSLIGNYSEKIK